MAALFHQFGRTGERIVLDVCAFFLQAIYLDKLLLAGISVVYIEDGQNHNQYQEAGLPLEEVIGEDVSSQYASDGCPFLLDVRRFFVLLILFIEEIIFLYEH